MATTRNNRIANQAGGYEVSDSKKRQTFLHELTHAILFAMGKSELNDSTYMDGEYEW